MCDHQNREAAMVVLRHDINGDPTVWCDPCLVPLVEALNAGGLPTIASCCGHGRRPGSVALADGREPGRDRQGDSSDRPHGTTRR